MNKVYKLIFVVICFLLFIQIETEDDKLYIIENEEYKEKIVFEQNKESIYDNNENIIVFITKTGKLYHREMCGSLHSSKIQSTLKKAQDVGLTPCYNCNPPE